MPPFLFMLIAVAGVVLMLLWAGALIDAAQYEDRYWDAVGRDKRPTLILILLTWGFGGLWYWLRVRPGLVALRRG